MAALSDTPTQPTILASTTSEAGGVSIKLEQGVFHENDYGSGVVYHNVERRGNPNIKYDSNHPSSTTTMENGSNILGNGNNNHHFTDVNTLQTNIQIKNEPAVDIDDYQHPDEEAEENSSFSSLVQKSPGTPVSGTKSPQIRLTPTSKLIATTTPSTAAADLSPNQKRRYVCFYENCTKSYGKSSHLRSHLTWHTGIKPFVCQESGCGKGFTRSDELNRHTRTHTGEKPFSCTLCTKRFSRSDHLTKHLATHSKQSFGPTTKRIKAEKVQTANANSSSQPTVTPLVLSSATANVESSIDYNDGMHFMAGLIENMPQKEQSPTPENLTDHVEEVTTREPIKIKLEKPASSEEYQVVVPQQQHNKPPSPVQPEINIVKTPTNFNIKPEPIDNETELRIKSEVMHEENEPDDDAIMPEANLPPFNTTIVSTTISSSTSYVPATICGNVTEPPYVPVASAPGPYVVTSSVSTITDTVYDPSRPFPCGTCTKSFKRQDDLNRHMRTHTGEKPFACNECEKRFMRSDHLKKHMNTHTRVR